MRYGTKEYISYATSFFTLMGVLFFWTGKWIFLYIILVLVLPLLIPMTGIVLVGLWKKITHFVGKVNGWILLTIIFFVILSPIAIIRRLFGHDVLKIKKQHVDSYFNHEEKVYAVNDVEKMW